LNIFELTFINIFLEFTMKTFLKNSIGLFLFFTITIGAQTEVVCENFGGFNEGLAPVLINNSWGFMDVDGNIVIEPKFKVLVENWGDVPYFSNGSTVVMESATELVGYINTKGELFLPYNYITAFNFSENKAIVRIENDICIIDKEGNILAKNIVALNGYHSKFSDGLLGAQKEFASGYKDKTGNFVIEPAYDEIRDFSEGMAAVQKDYKWGFIDKSGTLKVPFQFTNEPKSFSDGRAFVLGTDNKWGIIDTDGKILVEPKYNQVFSFSGGFAVVSEIDNKFQTTFSIIDVNGESVKTFAKGKNSNETISLWSGFNEGLAVAMKGGQKGMIDTKGKVVVDFSFRELKPFSSDRAYAEVFDKKTKQVTKGFIDKKGKFFVVIKSPQF